MITLGLRALLAAIGNDPGYRARFIAKGGTVLRLLSQENLERLSTDLDLSGLELGPQSVDDHRIFAADLGRTATQILHAAYDRGTADIRVAFDEESLDQPHDESDPETITYRITVSAQLGGANPTVARSQAYKIDLTCDEYVDASLIQDLRITSYGIPIDVRIYAPLQSIAEKMRALLQKRRHFEIGRNPGNWVPRHLFDLVPLRRLSTTEQLSLLPELFRRKCACRKIAVDTQTRSQLLDERLLAAARQRDAIRAEAAWSVLQQLIETLNLP